MATTTKLVSYEDWLRMPEIDDAIEEVVNGEIVRMPLENGKLRTVSTLREGLLRPKHFPEVAVEITSIWPE